MRVLAFAVRWHAPRLQRLRAQQRLLVAAAAQLRQHLGDAAPLQRGLRGVEVGAGASGVGAGSGIGQHHFARCAADKNGRGQLLQTLADKAVQRAQLLRGLLDSIHAPLQKVATGRQRRQQRQIFLLQALHLAL